MSSCTLYNKHTPILEIELEKSSIMSMGKILNPDMLPIQLQNKLDLESLNKWFKDRRIPEKREGLREVRMSFPHIDDDERFFSLSDQYWVQRKASDTWEQFNFFTNTYNEDVGLAFFEPWAVNREKLSDPSPDRTTNGVLKKRWIRGEDGKSYLLKAGSVIYHQEPLSEVLASIMLKKLDIIPFVPYELVISGLRFCSRCPNFVTEDTEFVPASAIYNQKPRYQGETVYQHLLAMCNQAGIKNAKSYIDTMIVADKILCNNDRHLGNFGFLRSAENGKILDFAPLFDSGSAYWGKSDEVKEHKSLLFAEEEEQIFIEAGKNGLLKNAKSNREMINLIRMYPDIRSGKKDKIIRMVDEVDKSLETMSQETIDREEEKTRQKSDEFLLEMP